MKRKITVLFCLSLSLESIVSGQSVTFKQVKLVDFDLQSSVLITGKGDEISTSLYRSDVYWFPVKVPCTVLSGLVANGVYPDPYQGMNNMLIPDSSDEFNKKYNLEQFSHLPNNPNPWKNPYWYRTTFKVPSAFLRNQKSKCNHDFCKSNVLYQLADKYKIEIKNIISVGDSENDFCLIKESGIGVSFCSENKYLNYVADKVISERSFSEILDFAG